MPPAPPLPTDAGTAPDGRPRTTTTSTTTSATGRTTETTPETTTAAVRAEDLRKVHGRGDAAVTALDGVDVCVARGSFTAVMGPSGSGKSTLLHCLAGLDTVTSGRVWVGPTDITRLREKQLTRLRRDRVGFVFQAFNLLPVLSAGENVLLPLALAGRSPDPAWHDEVVGRLGLRDRLGHRPAELSGGQQQRVAVARALLPRPDVVFADEPTGNLDSRAGAEVLSLLRSAARETGQTVVMVTHDPVAASYADRVVLLADGRLAGEVRDPTTESVLAALAALGG
ncbi:ABC transporter ATP-binding protein [Pseudokineococcus basanitobsidens]|uniref:ABC transporter ATP-binding protein n=1 Tax=Pseudokineococcus basanitobsidens TaxID=1926649 RepID=A0ABU8RJJ4_9ACTN